METWPFGFLQGGSMDKDGIIRKIYWLEDKLLRSKDFQKQLQIHNELQRIRKKLRSQENLAV